MMHFVVTNHAAERAKERAGWHRSSLFRMLTRIYFKGVTASSPGRKVHHYLRCYQEQEPGRSVRAYGEHLFLFADGQAKDEAILITVLQLPHEIRAAVRNSLQHLVGQTTDNNNNAHLTTGGA